MVEDVGFSGASTQCDWWISTAPVVPDRKSGEIEGPIPARDEELGCPNFPRAGGCSRSKAAYGT